MSRPLGFLGGGQLARMSIQAAQRMGLACLSLDPDPCSPASQIAEAECGSLSDPQAVARVLARCGPATLENEFIPGAVLREACTLAGRDPSCVMPGIGTLETLQDKLAQRAALHAAGVPAPLAVALEGEGEAAVAAIGFPMVLKARFGGYDGKGTRYARSREELDAHGVLWRGGGWLAEAFVPFERELAAMVFVGSQGSGAYPTMETVQTDHVCDLVFPSDVDGSSVALAAVRAVDGHGLFGVELFQTADGSLLVNEIAPRPHNTGHYTLDWGGTSQFEQHVRLAMGWPLGDAHGDPVCMVNLLGQPGSGDVRPAIEAALEVPGTHVHWYGKAEARPGRKMGHLNVRGPWQRASRLSDPRELVARAEDARRRFYKAWTK